ncbi:kinase-like domain-containing protein, partial [Endogone sp. FLAS-F59071]
MGGATVTGFTTVFRATVKGADPHDRRVLVLKELHESMACEGIAHGDLHPGNVLFHHADIPFVVDVAWGDATARLHNDPGVYGSLAYLPPELFRNPRRPYTRQSDVYCLGILLWQIITGVPPRGHAGERFLHQTNRA